MKERENNTTCVIILGMHRSGTSCLAGSLQQYGLYLGEVFEQNPYNLKGNRENRQIVKLNNNLLLANKGSWENPPSKLKWKKQHSVERDRIINSFLSKSHKLWGFKDPRTLLTFDFWKEGLLTVKPVGIFRHPLMVAQSLYKRNNISFNSGLQLWKQYNLNLLSIWEEYFSPIISFDVLKDEFLKSIKLVNEYLGIFGPSNLNQHFFDDSLRNHLRIDDEIIIPDDILQIYEQLNKIYSDQMQKQNFT